MSLSDILAKILEEAQQQMSLLDGEYAQKMTDAEAQAEADYQAQCEALESSFAATNEQLQKKMDFLLRRETSVSSMQAKQDLIAKALQALHDRLCGLPADEYQTVVKALLAPLSQKSAKLMVPTARLEDTQAVASGAFEIQADEALTGGFVFHQGGTTIDSSFQTLIFSEYKDELTAFFAQKLQLV